MKKVHELLRLRPCKGDLGVEIECEGQGIRAVDTDTWKSERDGSLRGAYPNGSCEFVMQTPVLAKNLEKAFNELIKLQEKAVFKFSFRTSVHVHVNVTDLTEDEMLAFLYACLLLEEPLMNFCGETRKGNRFCLRMKDAEGSDKTLKQLFAEGVDVARQFNGDNIRYSAINVHALRKYGSIEFRGMRGNMDKAVLIPWCETLLHIREKAKELGTPIAVYNKFIAQRNKEFAEEMIGGWFGNFDYPELDRDVAVSFSLAVELPHLFNGKDKRKAEKEKAYAALHKFDMPEAIHRAVRAGNVYVPPAPPVRAIMDEIARDQRFTAAKVRWVTRQANVEVASADEIGDYKWDAMDFNQQVTKYFEICKNLEPLY